MRPSINIIVVRCGIDSGSKQTLYFQHDQLAVSGCEC